MKFAFAFSLFLVSFPGILHHRERKQPIHGGCCLAAGTHVCLGNGKDILIEDLKAGDTVMAFDRAKNIFLPSKVIRVAQTEHDGYVQVKFPAPEGISGNEFVSLTISNDHPVWIKDKGWCSVEPAITMRVLGMKEVKKLLSQDVCYTMDSKNNVSEIEISSINKIPGAVKAYTIVQLENNLDCYFAGNIVVGVEAVQQESGGE